ncbi:MAG: hypothetical protein AAGH74_05685 [Pseudomonadota bacterium]
MTLRKDPNRLAKYVLTGAIDGVLAGWASCAALLALDAYDLWTRASSQAEGPLFTLMFFLLTGITFGMLGIAWRVMFLLPREEDDR